MPRLTGDQNGCARYEAQHFLLTAAPRKYPDAQVEGIVESLGDLLGHNNDIRNTYIDIVNPIEWGRKGGRVESHVQTSKS